MIKTQIVALDKLGKFLNTKDRKIISIIPHAYALVDTKEGMRRDILKSVLIIYQEI